MNSILLTPYDGAILGPIAKLLGWIMNGIYMFMYNVFGIENVGLSIVILTIILYTCLTPFNVKQQKFSKLMQKMQPEIKAIQEKYKNKKDEASVMAMNNETQMVYAKYGVSPMGSCWQMLIQMPIWFALFRVFNNIPAYVDAIKDKYMGIAEEIVAQDRFAEIMAKVQKDFSIALNVAPNFTVSEANTIEDVKNFVVDVIYKVPTIDKLADYFPSLDSLNEIVANGADKYESFNYFLGLNISDTPWNIMGTSFNAGNFLLVALAAALPLFYFVVQKYSMKLTTTSTNGNKKPDPNDMMANQMNSMNKTMPIMMTFMCFITPVGLGIYWVVSAAYRIVQMMVLNKYFDKMDLDEIIAKNAEKAAKKKEKLGVYENQIREAAAMKTRTISSKASYDNSESEEEVSQLDRANELKTTAKPGSLSAKANMVREFNERNTRK